MNVEFEIKKQILIDALTNGLYEAEFDMPGDEEVVDFYDENYMDMCSIIDASSEFRCSGEDTNIDPEYSRHYESTQVATKLQSGVWVSWTYWYGGGKHGQPEEVSWISEAYIVACEEKEETIITRKFCAVSD